jgi:glycosyltransferase involved in cell wall biosynthesis
MQGVPEISVILSCFERIAHLEMSLLSLAKQRDVDQQFEVIVTDDGSPDAVGQLVRDFAREVSFPVKFLTHPHDGFRLSQCRNDGIHAASAPYLLFSDADMLFPPDHLHWHLAQRKVGWAMAGDWIRLTQEETNALSPSEVHQGDFIQLGTPAERTAVKSRHRRADLYRWLRHPTKPKLFGGNIAVWKSDVERINGFDEAYVGWGCEDDDLRLRLRRSGVRIASISHRTVCYHQWHPFHPTVTKRWQDGVNVKMLLQKNRPVRCVLGLEKPAPNADARLGVESQRRAG